MSDTMIILTLRTIAEAEKANFIPSIQELTKQEQIKTMVQLLRLFPKLRSE